MKNKLLLFILPIFLSVFSVAQDTVRIEHSKDIIYSCLEMEKAAGFEVKKESYSVLDTIVFLAIDRIKVDTNAPGYPIYILKQIHQIIEEIGIVGDYSQDDPYKNLLSYSLQSKKFDCDKYSFTFLAIAQKLHLPIYAVLLPSHMAIEWAEPKHTFYWETTDKKQYTKEDYVSRFRLNKYHFNQNMYLTRITEKELKMCYSYNIGLTQLMIGKYKEAQKNFDAAKELKGIYPFLHDMMDICVNQSMILDATEGLNYHSGNDSLLLLRAKAFFYLKGKYNYNNALKDLDMILAMNTEHADAHIWKGKVYMDYFKLGRLTKNNPNYKKALKEFDSAIAKAPSNAEAYLNRSILHRWARQYEAAEKDINEAIKLHSTELALTEKGNLYFNQKKYSEAITYYNLALEKNKDCIEAIQCRGFAKLELEKRDEAAADFFQAYYYGLMPYEYFQKYVMQRPE